MAPLYGALEGEHRASSFQHDSPPSAAGQPQTRRFQRGTALLAVGAVAAVALTAKLSGHSALTGATVQADVVQTKPNAPASVVPMESTVSNSTATAVSNSTATAVSNSTATTVSNSTATHAGVHIYTWNEYATVEEEGLPALRIPGLNLYKAFAHQEVVEPYRQTTLRLKHGFGEDVRVSWTISRQEPTSDLRNNVENSSDLTSLSGETVTHTFTGAGYKYAITANVSSANGTVELESVTTTVNALYVRRELRQLNDADRKALLAAMWVPYSTSEDEGKLKYGPNYMALESIHQMHNYWASDRQCDHLHDGYGFSTQHLALTLRYEAVLQAVNPAVVVPYWEYTMDAANIYENYDGNYNAFYEVAPVFDDKWFGNFHSMNQPWRSINLTSTSSFDASRTRTNPFGLMRSPWNFAQEPNIVRYDQRCGFNTASLLDGLEGPSSCESFAEALSYTKLTDFTWDLMESPHGSIHILMGGISGACDTEYKKGLSGHFDESSVAKMGALSAIAVKELWRTGYVNFTSCAPDRRDECAQECPTNPVAAGRHLWHGVLQKWGLVPLNMTDEEGYLAAIGKTIGCTPLSIGDMYASSATIDPLFWVMHTTTDRLQTFKRGKRYNFTDTEWPDNKACFGHSPGDVTIFDVSVGLDLVNPSNLTNMDVYRLTDPTSPDYAMKYVYGDFDYAHCNLDKYPVFRVDYMPDSELPLTKSALNHSASNVSSSTYIPSKDHTVSSMLG